MWTGTAACSWKWILVGMCKHHRQQLHLDNVLLWEPRWGSGLQIVKAMNTRQHQADHPGVHMPTNLFSTSSTTMGTSMCSGHHGVGSCFSTIGTLASCEACLRTRTRGALGCVGATWVGLGAVGGRGEGAALTTGALKHIHWVSKITPPKKTEITEKSKQQKTRKGFWW